MHYLYQFYHHLAPKSCICWISYDFLAEENSGGTAKSGDVDEGFTSSPCTTRPSRVLPYFSSIIRRIPRGKGDSNSIRAPVFGCTNPSVRACSAIRRSVHSG
jgi:hypothetical protein